MAKDTKYKGFVNLGLFIKQSLKFLKKEYDPALLILHKNWSEIIGGQYCKYCKPEHISFKKTREKNEKNGVLYIEVYNSVLSMYIESNKKFVLDKINILFGYKAIIDIKIKQTPKIIVEKEYCKKKAVRQVNKKEEDKFLSRVNPNMDKGLKEELEELGKNILIYRK
jgi:hypothetical protein